MDLGKIVVSKYNLSDDFRQENFGCFNGSLFNIRFTFFHIGNNNLMKAFPPAYVSEKVFNSLLPENISDFRMCLNHFEIHFSGLQILIKAFDKPCAA